MRDIKLWYAYNEKDEVVRIEDIKEGEKYHCPCCGEGVYPKALKSTKVTSHFCHESGKSCSINGGENFIHKFVKEVVFQKGQQIKVNIEDGIKEYTIDEIILEKSYKTSLGDYRPDITLLTKEGERIFIEICNTNRKSIDKYWGKWLYLSNMVIELKAKDLINNKFEIGILEPIFPTFENMSNSDWKSLTGNKNINNKNTNEDKRKFLFGLYKLIYEWERERIEVNEIAKYLFENRIAMDIKGAYSNNEGGYQKAIISEYICDTIKKDKNDIYYEIDVYLYTRKGHKKEEYDNFIELKNKAELMWEEIDNELKKQGLTEHYWYGNMFDIVGYISHNREIKLKNKVKLMAKKHFEEYLKNNNKYCFPFNEIPYKIRDILIDEQFFNTKDEEINIILEIYNCNKEIYYNSKSCYTDKEQTIHFIEYFYSHHYKKDLKLFFRGLTNIIKQYLKFAKSEEAKAYIEYEEIYKRHSGLSFKDLDILENYLKSIEEGQEEYKIENLEYTTIDSPIIKEYEEKALEIMEREKRRKENFELDRKLWREINKEIRKRFKIRCEVTESDSIRSVYYYYNYYTIINGEREWIGLDLGYGTDNEFITIESFNENIAIIKSHLYGESKEYYLNNEKELYKGVYDLLRKLQDAGIPYNYEDNF